MHMEIICPLTICDRCTSALCADDFDNNTGVGLTFSKKRTGGQEADGRYGWKDQDDVGV